MICLGIFEHHTTGVSPDCRDLARRSTGCNGPLNGHVSVCEKQLFQVYSEQLTFSLYHSLRRAMPFIGKARCNQNHSLHQTNTLKILEVSLEHTSKHSDQLSGHRMVVKKTTKIAKKKHDFFGTRSASRRIVKT